MLIGTAYNFSITLINVSTAGLKRRKYALVVYRVRGGKFAFNVAFGGLSSSDYPSSIHAMIVEDEEAAGSDA